MNEQLLRTVFPEESEELLPYFRWNKQTPPPGIFDDEVLEWAVKLARTHEPASNAIRAWEIDQDFEWMELGNLDSDEVHELMDDQNKGLYQLFYWMKLFQSGDLPSADRQNLDRVVDWLQTAFVDHQLEFSHLNDEAFHELLGPDWLQFPVDSVTPEMYQLFVKIWSRTRAPYPRFEHIKDHSQAPVLQKPFTWFSDAMRPMLRGFVSGVKELATQHKLPKQLACILQTRVCYRRATDDEKYGQIVDPWPDLIRGLRQDSVSQPAETEDEFNPSSESDWKDLLMKWRAHDQMSDDNPVGMLQFDCEATKMFLLALSDESRCEVFGESKFTENRAVEIFEQKKYWPFCACFWCENAIDGVRLYFSFGKYRLRLFPSNLDRIVGYFTGREEGVGSRDQTGSVFYHDEFERSLETVVQFLRSKQK